MRALSIAEPVRHESAGAAPFSLSHDQDTQ
jgi:hypothetical protein